VGDEPFLPVVLYLFDIAAGKIFVALTEDLVAIVEGKKLLTPHLQRRLHGSFFYNIKNHVVDVHWNSVSPERSARGEEGRKK
jgi:hypothetical protein